MIIAAYAGVGKTTFCTNNQGNAIDVICMPFKYSNFYEVSSQLGESEDIKANEKLELRDNWELYYYWAIKYLVYYCPEKYIVIPTINSIMDFLEADGIPYTIVYPNTELKDEYEQRYLERGNSQSFMDVFIGQWEYRLESLVERKCKKIVLESHQYLSDVIDCSHMEDTYISRQLISFENTLKGENSRVKRAKIKEIDDTISDAICGVLYVKPLCEDDVVDDFVLVNSKKLLKYLLEDIEEGIEGKVCFTLLYAKYTDGRYQCQEKVFESKELNKFIDFL